jgi:putative transposase
MPRNVYWELFYHFVWRTNASLPMLTPPVEAATHKILIHRALKTTGAIVHAVGGTENHIHLAVSLPPTVELARWIGELKGGSAYDINHGPRHRYELAWQTGYGVVSFGKKDLPWVLDYIRNQREHHASGRAEDRLERITHEEPEGDPNQAR